MAFKIAGLLMLVVVGVGATRTKDRMVEMKDTVRNMVKNQMKQLQPDNGMTEEELQESLDKNLKYHDIYQGNAMKNLDDKTYKIVMDTLKNLPAADPSSLLESKIDVDDNTGAPLRTEMEQIDEPEEVVHAHNLRRQKAEEYDETDSEMEDDIEREHIEDMDPNDFPDPEYQGESEGSEAWGSADYVDSKQKEKEADEENSKRED